jgi:hypothetical protein
VTSQSPSHDGKNSTISRTAQTTQANTHGPPTTDTTLLTTTPPPPTHGETLPKTPHSAEHYIARPQKTTTNNLSHPNLNNINNSPNNQTEQLHPSSPALWRRSYLDCVHYLRSARHCSPSTRLGIWMPPPMT